MPGFKGCLQWLDCNHPERSWPPGSTRVNTFNIHWGHVVNQCDVWLTGCLFPPEASHHFCSFLSAELSADIGLLLLQLKKGTCQLNLHSNYIHQYWLISILFSPDWLSCLLLMMWPSGMRFQLWSLSWTAAFCHMSRPTILPPLSHTQCLTPDKFGDFTQLVPDSVLQLFSGCHSGLVLEH